MLAPALRALSTCLAVLAAALTAGVTLPAAANAAAGDFQFRSCLAEGGEGCPQVSGLSMPHGVAISPDGRNLYLGRYDGLTVFARDPTSGRLEKTACFAQAGSFFADGCTEIAPLGGWVSPVVSPDGNQVYATAFNSNAVMIFDRDPGGGALTPAGCVSEGGAGGCGSATALHAPARAAFSDDGTSLYVTGAATGGSNGQLIALQRNTGSGALMFLQCFAQTMTAGCTTSTALQNAWGVVVSHDGGNVYTVGGAFGQGSLARWGRNAMTGGLMFQSAIALPTGRGVAVSPDDQQVYTASSTIPGTNGQRLNTYARNSSTGALALSNCISLDGASPCTRGHGLGFPYAIAVSPDGHDLYVAANGNTPFGGDIPGAVIAYTRAGNGALTERACLAPGGADGCGALAGLESASTVAVSPDNGFVYTGSGGGGGLSPGQVSQFVSHELGPTCLDTSVPVAFQTPAAVTLPCSDPNGDALTWSIATPPAHGALGTIDQATGSVPYTPAGGFSGADSFTFSASDGDLASAPATANLAVAAAPPPLKATIGSLTIRPRRFRAARRGPSAGRRARVGARVRYTLDIAASVRFTVQRARRGWRRGGRCVLRRPKRPARRCTKYVKVRGAFAVAGRQGANSFRFRGRLRNRRLRPGGYRLTAVPVTAAGKGSARRARFRIVR